MKSVVNFLFLPVVILLSILIGISDCISLDDDADLTVLHQRLRHRISCHNKQLTRRLYQKGKFWVVQNFAAAEHGQIDCHSTVTICTIADVSYLDNLAPLVRRWRAPISLTLYAPGDDLYPTVESIRYLRNCLRNPEDSNLIREFVSFHLYFEADHITQDIPDAFKEDPAFCERNPMKLSPYRSEHNMSYYINIPRNIAQDAAITHYIFHTDIELYPSENLAHKFLHMIAFDERPLIQNRAYVVPTFEVTATSQPPATKRQLIKMLKNESAFEFHVRFCPRCAKVPAIDEWKEIPDSDHLKILTTVKRVGQFDHWEPFFIVTNKVPYYEERHLYSGKSDRMTQAHMMCLLDYDFSVLDNVFMVHRPGVKLGFDAKDKVGHQIFREKIIREWLPEYASLFGPRKGCRL